MTPRLTSAMLVAALCRRVAQEGGNAAVLQRGDEHAGQVLLLGRERGEPTAFFERTMAASGSYRWEAVGPPPGSPEAEAWLDRRRDRDPDCWLVELDIPNAQRLAAEISGDD